MTQAASLKPIDLLVFDLDGTLLDSFGQLVTSLNLALKACDLEETDPQRLHDLFHQGTKHLLKDLVGDDPELHKKIQHHYFSIYRDQMHASQLFPGVVEMLTALKKIKRLALLTNKQEKTTHLLLEHHHLNNIFEVIIGGDSLPTRKPSPVPLEHICASMHTLTKNAAMIGDSFNDIESGHAAGALTIAVLNGNGAYTKIGPQPDMTLDHVADLTSLFCHTQ